MKYLIMLLLIAVFGCGNNPSKSEDYVDIYIKLKASGYSVKVFCEKQLVTYLTIGSENDTISVPDGSNLKAKIYHDGRYTYEFETAYNGLYWELP